MYTRQRTRNIGRDPDEAEPRAPKALGRESAQGRTGTPGIPCAGVGVGGSPQAGSPGRRAAEAAIHSPLQPAGEKLWEGERRSERQGCLSYQVMGAKRLRRSRWERGTYERVAREGVLLMAGAGGYITRIE